MKLNLETHIIQSFPFSNLNRDDTGSPKDCVFGGTRRGRISSQCLKRSIRRYPGFAAKIEEAGGDLGTRTKELKKEIVKALVALGIGEESAVKAAANGIRCLGLAFESKNVEKTQYLLFLGKREIAELIGVIAKPEIMKALLAAELNDETEDKADLKKAKKKGVVLDKAIKNELIAIVGSERLERKGYAADIALFGRMMADDKDMNVNAACQVAHAFSTHAVETEFDYYTAVDELNTKNAGAGMVGIQEYNSACYYRYANLSIDSLLGNLGGDGALARVAAIGFAEAAVKALPSGKQNSTAAFALPSYVRFVVRKDGAPVSMAGAFSNAIEQGAKQAQTNGDSIEHRSINALEQYFAKIARVYGKEDIAADVIVNIDDEASPSLAEALGKVEAAIVASLGA